MTIFLCPHIPIPAKKAPPPAEVFFASCTQGPGRSEIRWLCDRCAAVLTFDGRMAWSEEPECTEDFEPGAEYAVMAPPLCGNRGCDGKIEKDGYCKKCWPKCHLVDCCVEGCENCMPVEDAEEFDRYCSDHRALPYKSYQSPH